MAGSTWLVARFTRAELDEGLAWTDVIGMSLLAGIGFTVSLLIGELAFGAGSRMTSTSRSASSPVPWPPHSRPPSCWVSATAPTGESRSARG